MWLLRTNITNLNIYNRHTLVLRVIAGFRREVDENRAVSGNLLPTFRDKLSVPYSGSKNTVLLDGTDRFSRNVG